MLIASIFKEMRLLSRDLHGVAVLFIMPILFMLIMSAALSNDNALSNRSDLVLLSEKNQLNDNFLTQLKKENLAVKQASLSELTQYQAELQAGKFDLLILNPNKKQTALSAPRKRNKKCGLFLCCLQNTMINTSRHSP